MTSAGDLALYEHGSFATIPDIALFERMLRQPTHLEVLTHNGILGREQQIAALAEVLHTLLAEPTSDEV